MLRSTLSLLLVLSACSHAADPDYLRYLPSDTKVLLAIHPDQVEADDRKRGEEFLRQFFRTQIDPGLGKTDALPISEVTHIIFAQPFLGGVQGVMLIQGKLDRKRLEAGIKRSLKRGGLGIERIGNPGVTVYRRVFDEAAFVGGIGPLAALPGPVRRLILPGDVHIAALDERTLFVSLAGKAPLVRAIRARTEKKPRTSEEMTRLVRAIDSTDLATLVVAEDSLHPALALVADPNTREGFDQFESLRGRRRAPPGKDVRVTIEIKGKSSEASGQLEGRAKQALGVVKDGLRLVITDPVQRLILEGLLLSFRVTRKDNLVTMEGALPVAEARKLLAPRPAR